MENDQFLHGWAYSKCMAARGKGFVDADVVDADDDVDVDVDDDVVASDVESSFKQQTSNEALLFKQQVLVLFQMTCL